MSTFPRVYRPPAQSDIGETLKKVREKAAPELLDLFEDEVDYDGQLLIEIHIQDGVVNHIKVAVKRTFDLEAPGVVSEAPKDSVEERVAGYLKSGLLMLQGCLRSCLSAGYHGVVTMQFSTRWKKCRLFSCEAKQTHRVQSGRVPA